MSEVYSVCRIEKYEGIIDFEIFSSWEKCAEWADEKQRRRVFFDSRLGTDYWESEGYSGVRYVIRLREVK